MSNDTNADAAGNNPDLQAAGSAETIAEPTPPKLTTPVQPGSWEGKRIGGIMVSRQIGQGAMGAVFEGSGYRLGSRAHKVDRHL